MLEYSEKLIEHFENPKNVGVIEDPDGVGRVTSDVCGDLIILYIKVKDERIVDIKYKTFGCAAAIASGSALTEMAKGLTIEDALKITKADVIRELDGMPEPKIHCSLLATDGLRQAIEGYRAKKGATREEGATRENSIGDADQAASGGNEPVASGSDEPAASRGE
jgi:nitrogen fixation NifU-like protein